jgi:ribonuclease P/MRP protein subunit RPP40
MLKAFNMLGVIKRNFKHVNKEIFILLYKSMVRPIHVDYCSSVWAPYKQKARIELGRVQKRATKLIYGLEKLSYTERLKSVDCLH